MGRLEPQARWTRAWPEKLAQSTISPMPWFIGYTPTVVCGVWIGYSDQKKSLGGGRVRRLGGALLLDRLYAGIPEGQTTGEVSRSAGVDR
jgi:membrane peptidoglycan carboxypeptidase